MKVSFAQFPGFSRRVSAADSMHVAHALGELPAAVLSSLSPALPGLPRGPFPPTSHHFLPVPFRSFPAALCTLTIPALLRAGYC